jgi:hypothetical protein
MLASPQGLRSLRIHHPPGGLRHGFHSSPFTAKPPTMGQAIQLLQIASYLPRAEFLDWHEDQVFKKPGRDAN